MANLIGNLVNANTKLLDDNKDLKQENECLKSRIKEVIEYLTEYINNKSTYIEINELEYLIKILKGGENYND